VEAFGHPEATFKSIHVAGTNGKGSTAAFLGGILRATSCRVGLYTSPHLLDFRERILVDGHAISEKELAVLATEVAGVTDRIFAPSPLSSPTFFEAVTALAFLHFARVHVDWGVIEVGLGGRSDATNILQSKVSVITNIGLEHEEHLGDSLASIAAEKAGIIRDEGLVVSAAEGPALDAIGRIVREKGARLIRVQDHYQVEHLGRSEQGETFRLRGRIREYDSLQIPLAGRHQVLNAATAVAVAELLEENGYRVGEAAIRQGLAAARCPGRLQVVARRPRILVDGAHNAWERMLAILAPLASAIILTRPESDRGAEPRILASTASRWFRQVQIAETMPEALAAARTVVGPEDTVLVTGSLFTAAGALRALDFAPLF
jgi:dihydrofolate synthase/folylpolyglutamate synthase